MSDCWRNLLRTSTWECISADGSISFGFLLKESERGWAADLQRTTQTLVALGGDIARTMGTCNSRAREGSSTFLDSVELDGSGSDLALGPTLALPLGALARSNHPPHPASTPSQMLVTILKIVQAYGRHHYGPCEAMPDSTCSFLIREMLMPQPKLLYSHVFYMTNISLCKIT